MQKVLLFSCSFLSSISFSLLPAVAMMETFQEQPKPRIQHQRLKSIELYEAEIQNPWPAPSQQEKMLQAITFFRNHKEEDALSLLEEGARRRHPEFMKQLGQYYVRKERNIEALKWLVLGHQTEFFTTFKNNSSYFTPLKNTNVEEESRVYQEKFKKSSIVNVLLLLRATQTLAHRTLTPEMLAGQVEMRNQALRMLSVVLTADAQTNTPGNAVEAFPVESWLSQTERVAKAYWIMRLIPKEDMNAESISENYLILSSEHFGTTLSQKQVEKLKWSHFRDFCTRFLPKLPVQKEFQDETTRPLSLLFSSSPLTTIDLTEYLVGIVECAKEISKLRPSNQDVFEIAYLQNIESRIKESVLEESKYVSALQYAKKKGCPENLHSYIEGLFYKYNKIGRSLSSYKRYKNACDLFKKSNFTTSLEEWVPKLEHSLDISEHAMVLKTLIQLAPSFAASNPVQVVVECYVTLARNLLSKVSFPESLLWEREVLEETKNELLILISESTDYIKNNWQSAMRKEAFFLGAYSLLSEFELDLTQQERIKLLKESREILEVARAHGDRMARGMLVYTYLMLEILDKDGNEYYKHVATLLEELGVKFTPVSFQQLLTNIKEYFQNEASDEAHLKDFFTLVCNDIAHNAGSYECFSKEIKEIIEGERMIISLPISAEPTAEIKQENKIHAVTGGKLQGLEEPEAPLEGVPSEILPETPLKALSGASETGPSLLLYKAEPLIRRVRKPQKPKGPNSRQKLLEKILSLKQTESPRMPSRFDISFSNDRVKVDFIRYKADPNFQRVFIEVIESIKSDPFGQKDIKGQPELLRGNYSGHWSRRLNKEHRVVYTVLPNGVVKIVEVGAHYQRSK